MQIAEKRRPWYRQAALLVSLAALVFTVGNTLWTRSSDTTAKGNERLQAIISQVSEIRTEEAKDLLTAKTDFGGYATRTGLRNTKRIALLEDADAALAETKGKASTAIYVALGYEAASQGQYKKADEYYTKGVEKAAPQTYERLWAKFDQAQLRLIPNSPLYNPTEGRKLYEDAIAEVGANDDNSRYQRGQVFLSIAQIETVNHDKVRAQTYLARAVEEAKQMNPLDPLRDLLNQGVTATSQASASMHEPAGLAFSQART